MRIAPDRTIDELVAERPELRPVLRALGIDACCGGSLTLAEAAAARGLAVAEAVRRLEAVLPAAAPPPGAASDAVPRIAPGDNLRQVLARWPATRAVLDRHGLLGCGGGTGPDESLERFAALHRVEPGALVAELEAASRGEAPPAAPSAPAAPAAPPLLSIRRAGGRGAAAPGAAADAGAATAIFRPFLRAALWCTLTLGALFGAVNLLTIHWALGVLPAGHNWIHAGFQIWGFVLLFIMGVSYHALPRFRGRVLARPALARASLPLALAGLLLSSYGRLGALAPWTLGATGAGALLQLAAVAAWAWVLLETWGDAGKGELFARFLAAGTGWWLVAAGLLVAGAASALASGSAEAAARWNDALYAAALFGGALGWVEGMLLRVGPGFLDLPPPRPRPALAAHAAGQAGTFLAVVGAAAVGRGSAAAARLEELGLLLVAGSVALFAAALRPRVRRGPAADRATRDLARLVALAFASGLLFALLGAAYALLGLAGASPARLLHDGARHALALGFLTLLVVALAGRILPVFAGTPLARPGLRLWGGYLIAAGVALREAQVLVVALREPSLLLVSGLSGVVAAAGVALAASSLLATLRAGAEAEAADPVPAVAAELAADTNVAALLSAHEEALPILVEAGFAPLANPVLRRTLARAVTLRQACALHHVDVEALLGRLRAACPHR